MNDHEGYDAPRRRQEQDHLDRWRLARQVLEIIDRTPTAWSVRIGLFGRYGSGKTTVLEFLQEQLPSDRYVPVWFNPSRLRDLDHLWVEFTARFLEAVEKSHTSGTGLGWLGLSTKAKVRLKRHTALLRRLSELSGAARQLVGGGIALAEEYFGVGSATLEQLRSKIGNKRVVVLIDDLDRTAPSLLPNLLLALRDLLAQWQFAFVLAFDQEVIANALRQQNPAWGSGREFLEKILDFTLSLPDASLDQRLKLLKVEVEAYAPFVPSSALSQTHDVLPSSPRELKLLVRHLAVLRGEVERHDPIEIDWISVIFAQLIRLKSERFLDRFLNLLVAEPMSRWNVYDLQKEEEKAAARDQELAQIFKELAIEDDELRKQLRSMVYAWLRRVGLYEGHELRYYANFGSAPRIVTRKECTQCFDLWRRERDIATVDDWIIQHSRARGLPTENVARELFSVAANLRMSELGRAADAFTVKEHEEHVERATDLLRLLGQLFTRRLPSLGTTVLQTPVHFRHLVETVTKYAEWKKNPADAQAREEERNIMNECAESVKADADAYLEALGLWGFSLRSQDQAGVLLRLAEPLERQAALEVLRLLMKPGGLTRLHENGESEGVKYILLRPSSALWTSPLRVEVLCVLDRASTDSVVQKNASELFELMVKGCRKGFGSVRSSEVQSLVRDGGVLGRVWSAIVANEAQYRMLSGLRENRKSLLLHGAPPDAMPMPEWLLVDAHLDAERSGA